MTSGDQLANLNDDQREAVLHDGGPMLVVAGPGSGKTRVVTLRLARLLGAGVPGSQLLALTFTNKAADEMRQRLERFAPGGGAWLGTFHRFGARMLRRYASLVGLEPNYSICDTQDSAGLLKEAVRLSKQELTHCTPAQIAQNIGWAKARMIGPDQYEAHFHPLTGAVTADVYPHYQRLLQQANSVDFDDLLYYVARLLRENADLRASLDAQFRYVMVDEYQDTNHAQYAIARALSIDHPNLVVTGDPDQSIYGWRGANIDNILEFERDFPAARVVRLQANYRSTPNILAVADALIAHNSRRKIKQLIPTRPAGAPVKLWAYPSDREEARHIVSWIAQSLASEGRSAGDFAIFYRTNSQSRLFEQHLRETSIPYQIVHGVEFYQRAEVRDALAYLQLVNNPRNDIAIRRIINVPPRRIGRKSLERLQQYATERRLSLLDACRSARVVAKLPAAAAASASAFSQMIDELSVHAQETVEQLLGRLLDRSGFREHLIASDAQRGEERAANLNELLNDAREFDATHPADGSLEVYLEQRSLVNDTDDWDETGGRVSLMTLHAAKGLEFPAVFVVGVEEGLLPHERSRENPLAKEEERRLFFVGITRAQQELHISFAHYRGMQGALRTSVPSSFLLELPREAMEMSGAFGGGFGGGLGSEVPWDGDSSPRDSACDEAYFSADAQAEHDEYSQEAAPSRLKPRPDRAARDRTPKAPPEVRAKPPLPGVKTAAELLQQRAGPPDPASSPGPNAFHQGMVVRHPEYGDGRIVSVGGSHRRRIATIRFFATDGEHKISLFHSKLTLVSPAESS